MVTHPPTQATAVNSSNTEPNISALSTIEDCDAYEKHLRSRLDSLEKRREVLVKNRQEAQADAQKEARLCIICCEKEKSVVLMPCRHMCLCEDCGGMERITVCPLCRKAIVHKISVYA